MENENFDIDPYGEENWNNTIQLIYNNEETFAKETVFFTEEFYNLATEIHDKCGSYGVLVVRKDKKSLCFPINLATERASRERGEQLYRVTIEKLEY